MIKGRFTVRGEDGAKTAMPGEVIFLTKGTKVVYEAEEPTDLVGATYPHWQDAQRQSKHADLLDAFHPVGVTRSRTRPDPFISPEEKEKDHD